MIEVCDRANVPSARIGGRPFKGHPTEDIKAFVESGADACIVRDTSAYRSVRLAQQSYCRIASRLGVPVSVTARGNRLYLLRKDV